MRRPNGLLAYWVKPKINCNENEGNEDKEHKELHQSHVYRPASFRQKPSWAISSRKFCSWR